jgi:putative ABC transport system permease protein
MIKQYLKISWRYLVKNRIFTIINTIGLSLGMFCVIIILLWINYETGFDKFHKNYDHLYRVVNNWGDEKDVCCPGSLAKYLKDNFPEVENAATYSVSSNIKLTYKNESHWVTGGIADSSLFKMFSFPLAYGNTRNIFPEPNSAIITRDLAMTFFGQENPLGKQMTMEFEDMEIDMTISGIVDQIPENSSLQFDFLISSAIAPSGYYNWTNNWPDIFVQIEGNSPSDELSKKITDAAKIHDSNAINTFELKPFAQEHLYNLNGGGLINYVRIFSLIAIIVLLMACFNYINLSTAQQITRQKEIGLRKVLGSSKRFIQKQFMGEVFIISFTAFVIALLGAKLFMPLLNHLLNINTNFSLSPAICLSLLSVMILTAFVSGIYPALHLASLNPLNAIYSKNTIRQGKKITLRKVVVISQFTFTIILIISLIGVFKQLHYIQNKDLGFNKDGILIIPLQGKTRNQCQLIKEELLKNPDVVNVAGTSFHPVMQEGETSFVDYKNNPEKKVSTKFNYVDYDYLSTFNIKMKEGRFFSKDFADQSSTFFVVNEELVKNMGMDDPIGNQMTLFGDKSGTIIGIMRNFHNESLHSKIREYTLMLGNDFNYLSVKVKSQNISKTIDFIGKKLKDIEPSFLFSYHFLDDEIKGKYFRDLLIGKLTIIFAILSIAISLLGLVGLILFTINQHTKEIGVRKVFGAMVSDILIKLNSDFIKWIIMSFVIATPVSVVVINKWFKNFAYKTEVSWWIFLIAGVSVLSITLLIVSIQSWSAANKNPVETLKYE